MGIKGLTKLLSDEAPDCLKDVSIAMGGCVDGRVRCNKIYHACHMNHYFAMHMCVLMYHLSILHYTSNNNNNMYRYL